MRYLIEVDENSPFFTTTKFDGSPEHVDIVAFTRGNFIGTELIQNLQECVDASPQHIDGDFQLARIIEEIPDDV